MQPITTRQLLHMVLAWLAEVLWCGFRLCSKYRMCMGFLRGSSTCLFISGSHKGLSGLNSFLMFPINKFRLLEEDHYRQLFSVYPALEDKKKHLCITQKTYCTNLNWNCIRLHFPWGVPGGTLSNKIGLSKVCRSFKALQLVKCLIKHMSPNTSKPLNWVLKLMCVYACYYVLA